MIGIGGDPAKGLNAAEAVELLHHDPDTDAILYLGEIGDNDEYAVARYAARAGAKPTAALIIGKAAPPGKKMGHAAALVGSQSDSQAAKVAAGCMWRTIWRDWRKRRESRSHVKRPMHKIVN